MTYQFLIRFKWFSESSAQETFGVQSTFYLQKLGINLKHKLPFSRTPGVPHIMLHLLRKVDSI